MTPASAPDHAVVVRLNGRKTRWQGVLFGAMTLLFGLPTLAAILLGRGLELPAVLGLAITAFFAALSLTAIGLSLRKPVALRMDADGISGWFTPPATWAEIASISLLEGATVTPLLGFALHDPIAFRDRQSPWQRLTSHLNGRSKGHHIVISEQLLLDMTAAQLLAAARPLHQAALGSTD